MRVEIKMSPKGIYPTFDLYVDGRKEIEGESYTVVSNIRDSLLGFSWGAFSEAEEIASEIKKNRRL